MSYLNRSDITVKNVVLLRSKTLLARVSVIFYEVIETHGWKVLKSNKMHPRFGEELWIQAPSYERKLFAKTEVKKDLWRETIYINDRRTRDLIEEMIYDAYHLKVVNSQNLPDSEVDENKTNLSEVSEEVNPDDIPF
jgi:hypothetical protein